MVTLLLDANADVNLADNVSYTSPQDAFICKYEFHESVCVIGIDVRLYYVDTITMNNAHHITQIMWLSSIDDRLSKRCSMLIQNGHTALIFAAGGGHASVVTLLLDAKADIDHVEYVRNVQKQSLLYYDYVDYREVI